MILLSKEQRQRLREALMDAFRDKNFLKIMVRDQLDVKLDDIVDGETLTVIVNYLIEWAESQGRLEELVRGAVQQNPGNKELQKFIENIDIKLLWKKEDLKDCISKIEQNFDSLLQPFESLIEPRNYDNFQKEIEILKDKDREIPVKIKSILLLKTITKYRENNELKIISQIINQQKPTSKKDTRKPNNTQPYLLIIFQPASVPHEYLVNAFLAFKDSNSINKYQDSNFIPLRNSSSNKKATNQTNQEMFRCKFKEKEITQQIGQFIAESYRLMNWKKDEGYSVEELIIEFCLPNEYIFEPIDMWKTQSDREAIGQEYRMVVRSWDRLDPIKKEDKEKFKYRLSATWDSLHNIIEEAKQQEIQKRFAHLAEIKDYSSTSAALNEKIGLKLTCVPPKSRKIRSQLLDVIFNKGIPIIIWTRCSQLPEINIMTEIDKFLTLDSLKDFGKLLKLIRDERITAAKIADGTHLGHHLAILYDECDRLPYLVNNILHNDEDILRIGR